MRKRIVTIVAMLLLFSTTLLLAQKVTGEDLFQQGLDQERGKRDIPAAIRIYERIVREFPSNRVLIAKTLVQLGICNAILGEDKAREYFEQVVSKYGDQPNAVKDARARLVTISSAPDIPAESTGIYIAAIDLNSSQVRGTATALPKYSTSGDESPSWLPDGTSIVFRATLAAGDRQVGRTVVVRNLETGKTETHGNVGGNGNNDPTYNGANITAGGDLIRMRGTLVNGRDVDYLIRYKLATKTVDQGSPIRLPFVYHQPIKTAQDDRTLYVAWNDPRSKTSRILPVDLKTGEQKEMIALPEKGDVQTIRLSPDGRTLALLRKDDEDSARIALIDVDSGGFRELLGYKGGRGLNWTKDGRALLFAQSDDKDNWQLMRIAAEGSAPSFTGLEIKSLAGFNLSPDGKQIAFSGTAYRINAPGVAPRGFTGGRISATTSNSLAASGPTASPAQIALWDASASGNLQKAADAIRSGADVDALDTRKNPSPNGKLPLHYAAEENNTDLISLLLDLGAKINATGSAQFTALHVAALAGSKEAAEVLIARGAALDPKNSANETPLDVAVRFENPEVADVLSEAMKLPGPATNPVLGVWKVNLEKSPGWPYSTDIVRYAKDLNGFVVMTKIQIDARGELDFYQRADKEDGEFYPGYNSSALSQLLVTGVDDPNLQSTRLIDTYTAEITFKPAPNGSSTTMTRTVSRDGKTLTTVTTTVNARGRTQTFTAVYDRQ